jgi:hypothetical protein
LKIKDFIFNLSDFFVDPHYKVLATMVDVDLSVTKAEEVGKPKQENVQEPEVAQVERRTKSKSKRRRKKKVK